MSRFAANGGPRVFALAGLKPALTENNRPLELDGWCSRALMPPSPRLRGLDEHDAFGFCAVDATSTDLAGAALLVRPNVRAKLTAAACHAGLLGENARSARQQASVASRCGSA